MTRPAQVDIEKLIFDALAANGPVFDLIDDRISAILPADLDTPKGNRLPWLQVFRIAGTYADPATSWLENARIQVSAWAATPPEAFELAQAATIAILDLPHNNYDDGVVSFTNIDATAYWAPDPDTALPRYIITATVGSHPIPVP
jgi:hypothetical protein